MNFPSVSGYRERAPWYSPPLSTDAEHHGTPDCPMVGNKLKDGLTPARPVRCGLKAQAGRLPRRDAATNRA